jgi:hypothetical protein
MSIIDMHPTAMGPPTLVPDCEIGEQMRLLREAGRYSLELLRMVGDQALAQLVAERTEYGVRGTPSLTLLYLKVSQEFRETMRLSIRLCTEQRRRESERRKGSAKMEVPASQRGAPEVSRRAATSDELDAMRAMIAADEAAAEQLVPEDAAEGAAQAGPSQATTTEPSRTELEEDPAVVPVRQDATGGARAAGAVRDRADALADRITPISGTRRADLLGHAAQAPRAILAAAILERRRR